MQNYLLISNKKAGLQNVLLCFSVFIPVISLLLLLNAFIINYAWLKYVTLLFTGWLSWTFTEYMTHRFWMHHPISNINSKTYKTHMNHHKHPTDIIITNSLRLTLLVGSFILICVTMWWNNYFTLIAGFYNGFVWYYIMHVILHKRWAAKFFPKLQESHIHHHCKYPNSCFSFSIIWWDKIFGTMPPANARISDRLREFYFTENHDH